VDGAVLVGEFSASHVSELGGPLSEIHPGAREASSNATQYINIPELYQIACIGEGGEGMLMNSQLSVSFVGL